MSADGWQEYIPERPSLRAGEAVALIGRGPGMRLSNAAAQQLGTPERIVFHWDRAGKRVGIRASKPDVKHSFPLRRYGEGTMFTIAAEGFYKWAGIPFDTRQEYPTEVADDGMLSFKLPGGADVGEFEEFILKATALIHQVPNVSISRNGNANLNQAAMRLIAPTERVVLLYDAQRKRIGFRPATTERHAKAFRPVKGQRTWTISAEGFFKQFQIAHEEGKSYEPQLADGVLVVDLNQPKPSFRTRKAKHEERDEGGR